MLFCVSLGISVEVRAGMKVGKVAYAQAVRGVKLGLQEFTTRIAHLSYLQDVGRREEGLGTASGEQS